jgi:hypothetical protein
MMEFYGRRMELQRFSRLPLAPKKVEAVAINASEDSVGYFENAAGKSVAAYWSEKGALTNINSILGSQWSDTQATGINAAGDVSGYGIVNGRYESFLLLKELAAAVDTAGYLVDSPLQHIIAASTIRAQ